jgi:hypothetical protein
MGSPGAGNGPGSGGYLKFMKSFVTLLLLLVSVKVFAQSGTSVGRFGGIDAASSGPGLVSANCVDGMNLEMLFDAPLAPASATNTAVYGVQVDAVENPIVSAKLKPDLRTVVLKMDQQVFASFVTVLVNGLQGSDGQFAYSSYPFIKVDNQAAVHLGNPADDPFASDSFDSVQPGHFNFALRSGKLGGVTDDCLFVGKPVGTNSFLYDAFLRPAIEGGTNASAGIMIRASTAADSPFYALFVTGSSGTNPPALRMRAVYRPTQGAGVLELPHSEAFPAELPSSDLRVSVFRSGADIQFAWNTSPSDSFHPVPGMPSISALSCAVLVGPAAAFLDLATPMPAHLALEGGLLHGDNFPPSISISREGGLINLSWPGANQVVATGAPPSPISTWKVIPIWPVVTNGVSTLRLKATKDQQFFALRPNPASQTP